LSAGGFAAVVAVAVGLFEDGWRDLISDLSAIAAAVDDFIHEGKSVGEWDFVKSES